MELICDLIDEMAPQLGGNSRKLITFVKDRPGHDRRYAIDATKIQRELGWVPAHTLRAGHPRDRALVSGQPGVGADGAEALASKLRRMQPASSRRWKFYFVQALTLVRVPLIFLFLGVSVFCGHPLIGPGSWWRSGR